MQLQVVEDEAENGEVREMKTSVHVLRGKEAKEFKSRFMTVLEALSFEIQWQEKQEGK